MSIMITMRKKTDSEEEGGMSNEDSGGEEGDGDDNKEGDTE